MDHLKLLALGFTHNEAVVYKELILLGRATARQLIQKTNLHKKIVYDNLERLMEKGIVSSVIDEGIKQFYSEDANSLLDYVEKKETLLKEQKNIAREVIEEIRNTKQQQPTAHSTRMLIGISGVKQIFKQAVSSKVPYASYGAPKESVDILGEFFWRNLNQKQKDHQTKGRIIFNTTLRTFAKKGYHPNNTIRFLDITGEALTQTLIFGDIVAIVVWSAKPIVTVIEDRHVAQSYTQFFEILWKQSKK